MKYFNTKSLTEIQGITDDGEGNVNKLDMIR